MPKPRELSVLPEQPPAPPQEAPATGRPAPKYPIGKGATIFADVYRSEGDVTLVGDPIWNATDKAWEYPAVTNGGRSFNVAERFVTKVTSTPTPSSQPTPSTAQATPAKPEAPAAPAEPALTPTQADQMARAQAEHEKNKAIIQTMEKDPEIRAKRLYAEGMKFAAIKRQITGKLTGKEQEAKAKREASNFEGKAVSVDGKNATVIGNAFGKVKVKFADGTTASVPADKIKSPVKAAAKEPVEASQKEASPAPASQPAGQAEVFKVGDFVRANGKGPVFKIESIGDDGYVYLANGQGSYPAEDAAKILVQSTEDAATNEAVKGGFPGFDKSDATTPEGRAETALAEYEAKVRQSLVGNLSKAARDLAGRKLDLAARLRARLKAMSGGVEFDVYAKELRDKAGELEVKSVGEKDSILFINPEKLINRLTAKNKTVEAAREAMDVFILHEFIHKAAIRNMDATKIIGLYNLLTPEAKAASKALYLSDSGLTDFWHKNAADNEFAAAHEWFAQLVEARLRGKISNQAEIEASQDPAFRDKLIALLKDFVAQLRDVAKLVTDKTQAALIEAEADAVQAIVADMAAKAGLEIQAGPEAAPQAKVNLFDASNQASQADEADKALADAFTGLFLPPNDQASLRLPPQESLEQTDLPRDRRDAMMKAASVLVDAGVNTPAELAARLDKLAPGGQLRQYSRAFWRLMSGFDSTLEEKPDWQAVYQVSQAAVAAEQPPVLPASVTPAQAEAIDDEAAMPEPAKQAAPFDAVAAKGQKKILLAEVAVALKAAPKRADLPEDIRDALNEIDAIVKKFANQERDPLPADSAAKLSREIKELSEKVRAVVGTITIQVPGDGTFTILNEKGALAQFQKRADKFPTTQTKDDMPARPTAQAPTAVPALKKPKTTADVVAAIYPMVSSDETRGLMTTVKGDGTNLWATNGRILVKVVQENGGGTGADNVTYDEKGNAQPWPVEKGNYNGEAIIPSDERVKPYTIDTGRWFSLMSQARAVIKPLPSDKSEYNITKAVSIYRNPDASLGVFVSDIERGDYVHNIQPEAKFLASYDPEYFQTILRVARSLGNEQIEFRIYDDISPATFRTGNATFVIMPMRVNGATAYSPQSKFARPVPPVTAQTSPAAQAPAEAPASQVPAVSQPSTTDAVKVEAKAGIADFGEKLGGARKDKAAIATVNEELTDDEITDKTLAQLWPKSEIDSIEDDELAAYAATLRSVIPTKPQKGYKLNAWVGKVKLVKELMRFASEKGVPEMISMLRSTKYNLGGFADKIVFLQGLPREQWDRIGEIRNYPNAYRFGEGVGNMTKIPAPYADATVDGFVVRAENIDALLEAVRAKVLKGKAVPKMEFEVRGRSYAWGINKKGDPLYRKLKTFENSKEALAYVKSNYAELVAAWEGVKERDNVKETDLRRNTNRPRTAEDWRKGKDATPEMYAEAFGFRGVEFGNWVSQGKNAKERQGMMNEAYDALQDLASILNVPTKALSLNGKIGLGFGSRGQGWASAHYEPGSLVINLTKTRGAGSLAHELFHAFDHYFGRARGVAIKDNAGVYITESPESRYVNKNTGQTITVKRWNEIKNGGGRINNEADWGLQEGVRPEVEESFSELVKALDASPMAQRARMNDKGKSDYWGSTIERAARSFENYVIYKMQQKGYQNDYLANVVRIEDFVRNPNRYPYLLDEEIAPVAKAFDDLFSTIKTRETDSGVALYNPPASQASVGEAVDKDLVKKVQNAVKAGRTVGTSNPTTASKTGEGTDGSHNVELKRLRKNNPLAYRQNALILTRYPVVAKKHRTLYAALAKADAPVIAAQAEVKQATAALAAAMKGIKDRIAYLKSIKAAEVKATLVNEFIAQNPMARAVKAKDAAQTALAKAKVKAAKAADYQSKAIADILDSKALPEELAEQIYEDYIVAVESNLLTLIKLFPQRLRDVARLWYDGANIIAQKFGKQYNATIEQASGVLAVFSPQKDWFMNVSLAQRMMNIWANDQDTAWSPEMTKQFIMRSGEPQPVESIKKGDTEPTISTRESLISDANPEGIVYQQGAIKKIDKDGNIYWENWDNKKAAENLKAAQIMLPLLEGKTLRQIKESKHKARFIRILSEVRDPSAYPIVTPDGRTGAMQVNNDKVTLSKVAWGGYNTIEKAIAIMSATPENEHKVISDALGDQHKVRSFYNNIVDPANKSGHVTMDTHAIAAIHWMPHSGSSLEVTQNFGGGGVKNDGVAGIKGTYAANAEAYRRAGVEFNLLPREVQSITWEAVRLLFPKEFKTKGNIDKVRAIWNKYLNGDINIEAARAEIFTLATTSKNYPKGKDIGSAITDGTGLGDTAWAAEMGVGIDNSGGREDADDSGTVSKRGGPRRPDSGGGAGRPSGNGGGRNPTAVVRPTPVVRRGVAKSASLALPPAAQAVPPFYSKLARVVADKMPNRADAATIKGIITNSQTGIKAEELKWSGILPWIEAQAAPITKQSVLDYLATDGAVRLEEVRIDAGKGIWRVIGTDQSQKKFDTKEQAAKFIEDEKKWARTESISDDFDAEEGTAKLVNFIGDVVVSYTKDKDDGKWYDDEDQDRQYGGNGKAVADDDAEMQQLLDEKKEESIAEWDDIISEEPTLIEGSEGAKFSQYQLPGGENYREVVLAIPAKTVMEPRGIVDVRQSNGYWFHVDEQGRWKTVPYDTREEAEAARPPLKYEEIEQDLDPSETYTSSHFPDVPNYVAHARLNDRADAQGRPGTFMEEIQSDRHQVGREKGYLSDMKSKEDIIAEKIQQLPPTAGQYAGQWGYLNAEGRYQGIRPTREAAIGANEVELRGDHLIQDVGAVPNAPFRKDWPLQMFKRALAAAVADGKQWIGWTTADTQFERWGSERFDWKKRNDATERRDKTWTMAAMEQTGGNAGGINIEQVARERGQLLEEKGTLVSTKADVLALVKRNLREGKAEAIAEKIWNRMQTEDEGTTMPRKEGMEAFYDSKGDFGGLVKDIGKYVKQWGAGVVKGSVDTGFKEPGDDETMTSRPAKIERSRYGWSLELEDGELWGAWSTPEQATKGLSLWQERFDKRAGTPIWRVDITPAMAASVGQGQSLFMPPAGQAVTPAQDAEYLELAKDPEKNRTLLQKMVDAVAKATMTKPRWGSHGTNRKFTIFKSAASWFSEQPDGARAFVEGGRGTRGKKMDGPQIYNVIVDLSRPLDFRSVRLDSEISLRELLKAGGMEQAEIESTILAIRARNAKANKLDQYRTDESGTILKLKIEGAPTPSAMSAYMWMDNQAVVDELKARGFDGILWKEEFRYPDELKLLDTFASFYPAKIKSADPVTRDESGEVIPLSERFNPQSNSILRNPPAFKGGPAASVPTQITRNMRKQLSNRGYTKEQIYKMKPAEAWAILNPPAEAELELEPELEAEEAGQTDADMEAFIAEQQAIAEEEAAVRESLRNDPDAIDAVQASGKMSGRNLSKQFEYPEARAVYQALTAARDQLGGPETVQLDKLREWAKKTFESDPEKYVQWAADMAEEGKMLDVDEQAVLGQAFQFLTREARLTGNKNIRVLLNKVGNYYLDTGTRLAQALSARRDPLEGPHERWVKALDIVFGPSEAVRRKLRILPTEAGKARRIASLEAELAEARGSRRADVEAALNTARNQQTKEELLEKDDAESEKIKQTVLNNIGVTEDDLMLSGTDRHAMQSAILELPAVKAGLEAYKGKDNDGYNIMRLAFRGFSDEAIANSLNLNQDDVGQFIKDATNAIIRPAVAEQVKAGIGFGGLIKAGFAKLKKAVGLGLPPKAIENQPALIKGTRQTVADVTAEVNRVMAYAIQSAKARNSGKLMSKVVMTPGGQKVRVFVPFDPDDMANYYAFAREYTAAKASAFDKVYEYWINWPLLSGPQTQVANITGNAAQVAWHYTGQRLAEATLNLAYQDPNSAQFREFKHVLKGFWQGIGPAFDMARQTFLTEGDTIRHKYLGEPMEINIVDGDLDKVGNIRASVGGQAGRINRLPGRVLRFTDAFFKTAIMYAEASAVAYRRAHVAAKAQGLKGQARATFIDTEIANTINDTSSAVWGEVMKTAEELLFQDDNSATEIVDTMLGGYKGIRDLEKLLAEAEAKGDSNTAAKLQKRIRIRKLVGSSMRWIFPFQRTPTNIVRAGIKKAGGSAISLLYGLTMAGWRKSKDGTDFIKSYPKAMQIKDASETLLAGLGWLALASMLEGDDNDDEKPVLLVGTRSHSLKERAATDQFLRKYGGENSIVWQDGKGKVLGSLPFGRYEPAATMLTTWIDAYRNYQEVKRLKSQGENASYSTYMLSSLVSSLEDKSFLQGFANAMQFVRDVEEKRENPDQSAGTKMLMNNIIPNFIKQPLRNMDEVLRERTTAGPGYAALPNPVVAPKLPVFAAQLKISTTGERMPKAFVPAARLLFQANTKVTPQADALLYRANRLNPTIRWSPQPLNRDDYTANPPGKAKPVPITDPAKRRQFAELAGRLYATKAAQIAAKAMPSEKVTPGESLIKAFKKAREDAMAAARAQAHAMGLHKPTITP